MFPGHKGSSTHEDTVIVITCVRPLHDQARQNPRMEDGNSHELSTIVKELLAIDS